MNDGRPDRRSARGGAEVIGSKDLTAIHHAAQTFISVLVLDGMAANEALAAIATARRTPVPDTDAQRDWLEGFESMVASG